MQCPKCGAANPGGKKFCTSCGTSLQSRCPACGEENPQEARFCGDCGASLAATSPVHSADTAGTGEVSATPDAERRQLTVMFCDLAGSTELSRKLDPEDLRDIIRSYQESVSKVIDRYEGFIARYMGDGVLVYFGYPQAHEDDSARAIHASLEIVDTMNDLNTNPGQSRGKALAVRVGIATGLVVAGELIGKGAAEEAAVVGETPNLAARLQGLAEPNTVVVAESTRRLVEGLFDYADQGMHRLKGFDQPVQAWRVLRKSAAETRFDAAHKAGLTALVGRDEEIEVLLRRWRRAKESDGQVVLISGEPGIGKSRVVQTLREEIAAEPHTRLRYQCSPYHTNSALYPMIDQLERAARFEHDDSPDLRLDKLEALLSLAGRSLADVTPLFGELLSIPYRKRYPELTLSAERRKEKILEAMVDQVIGLSERQPVLMILEDAHWIDPSSLELLDRIVGQAQDVRVLIIITSRPEFSPPWTGAAHVTNLTINRLSHRQGAVMVDRVVGNKTLPQEVRDQIIDKTDGVPLFLEELTKTLLESNLLTDKGDHYSLAGSLSALRIPTTLQDSLMARLDHLGSAKEIAQVGATIGREFPYELLAGVCNLPEEQLRVALTALVGSELVFERGMPPQAVYTFKHALVQDAAYQSLLRNTRQQYHERIARVMEARFPETAENEPELLAYHYTEADLSQQAIEYWQRAGTRAVERSAYMESIAHLNRALGVTGTLPDRHQRAEKELAINLALGPALMASKGWGALEVEKTYIRAQELSREIGQLSQLFAATWGLWMVSQQFGQIREAQRLANEVLALADQQSDLGFRLQAHHAAWTTLFRIADFCGCRDHAEQGMSLYDINEHRHHASIYGGHDPGACARTHGGLAHWFLGYPDQALNLAEDSVHLSETLAQPFSIAVSRSWKALVHEYRNEPELVRDETATVIALSQEQGFAQMLARGEMLQGWALAAMGQLEEGQQAMERGVSAYRVMRAGAHLPHLLSLLAEVYARSNQLDRAFATLTDVMTLIEKSGERTSEADVYRRKGELLLMLDGKARQDAEVFFKKAIDVAREQKAKSLELRAATILARLWRDQGKKSEARDLLAPTYKWFTEGFDTTDLKEAKVLLKELG